MVIGQVAVGSEIEFSKNKYAREGCNKNQTFASSDEKWMFPPANATDAGSWERLGKSYSLTPPSLITDWNEKLFDSPLDNLNPVEEHCRLDDT